MSDAMLLEKAAYAVGPALFFAVVFGAFSVKWPTFAPWAAAITVAVGMLPALLIYHGDIDGRWRWVAPAAIISGAIAALAMTGERRRLQLLSLALFVVPAVFLKWSSYDTDGWLRVGLLVCVPLVLLALPWVKPMPTRLDATAIAISALCLAPSLLLIGHDALTDIYATIPFVAFPMAAFTWWKPSLGRALNVVPVAAGTFAVVGWNSSYEPRALATTAVFVIAACPLLLLVPLPRKVAWLPAMCVMSVAVAAVVTLVVNTDLAAYG